MVRGGEGVDFFVAWMERSEIRDTAQNRSGFPGLRFAPSGLRRYVSGHNAFTIASSPSVSAAGPGWRISGDLISTMRLLRTAGISFQPGRCRILSGTTFLPHHDARMTFGAASRTMSGDMMRSF